MATYGVKGTVSARQLATGRVLPRSPSWQDDGEAWYSRQFGLYPLAGPETANANEWLSFLSGEGVVGYWPLDGHGRDESGYGNDAALTSGVAYFQAPHATGVKLLSPKSLTISPAAQIDNLIDNGGMTLSFWINMVTVGMGGTLTMLSRYGTAPGYACGWRFRREATGVFRLDYYRGGALVDTVSDYISASSTMLANWVPVTARIKQDGTAYEMELNIDGGPVQQKTGTNADAYDDSGLSITSAPSTGSWMFADMVIIPGMTANADSLMRRGSSPIYIGRIPDCEAWYPLNVEHLTFPASSLPDLSGNYRSAFREGTVQMGIYTGAVCRAVNIPRGLSNVLRLPDVTPLNKPFAGGGTFCAWFYYPTGSVSGALWMNHDGTMGVQIAPITLAGDIGIYFWAYTDFAGPGFTYGDWHSDTSCAKDVWIHYAVLWDSEDPFTDPVFYVNGLLVPTVVDTPFPVGYNVDEQDEYSTVGMDAGGMLDELAFFSRKLTADEIASIYAGGV